MRGIITWAAVGWLLVAAPAFALKVYTPDQLQRELSKAQLDPQWQALDGWLTSQGYVRDSGQGGAQEPGQSGVMISYYNALQGRSAILDKWEGTTSDGIKKSLFHVMIFYYQD